MDKILQALRFCLSYIHEIQVEKVESKVSKILKVTFYKGRYLLNTPNAIYSHEDQYTSFRVTFEKLKPESRNIKKSLILGYGLGSIPLMLSKRNVHCDFTAVESDPAVLELAKKYGHLPDESSLDLICADAYSYVLECKEQFDLINVDLYIDDITPAQFEKEEFLNGLKKILSKSGLLIFSRFYYEKKHRDLTDRFKEVFQKAFPGSQFVKTDGNLMFVYDASIG